MATERGWQQNDTQIRPPPALPLAPLPPQIGKLPTDSSSENGSRSLPAAGAEVALRALQPGRRGDDCIRVDPLAAKLVDGQRAGHRRQTQQVPEHRLQPLSRRARR